MLFKVTFELPLVAQSQNKMHCIWSFTEVLQSPIKIWVSGRKRRREEEVVWTNSSFKSELKHPWVRHKDCHFRSPAWCVKHTQELGLPHRFPWHCRSLWRAPGHRIHWEEEGFCFNGPSTVRSYLCLLSASSQGQQECQIRKAEKCCSCLVAAQEESEDLVTTKRKAVQKRQRESRSYSNGTCTEASIGKPWLIFPVSETSAATADNLENTEKNSSTVRAIPLSTSSQRDVWSCFTSAHGVPQQQAEQALKLTYMSHYRKIT